MKTLLLIRHGKSSWDDVSLNDFDRPLNDRGKQDAPAMAGRLQDKKTEIDVLISSPAKRAGRTAKIFAKEYGINKADIIYKTELYLASAEVFYEVISKADDKFEHIAVFSHNPGLTDFANELTDIKVDNIPTCGIFAIRIETKPWVDFKNARKEFWFFDYPKAN
ncbi:MAG TPA: histidine phosphatase family protein [Chitinophagaceae bacterium]|nr:histidine phosphatase family protein [Chitinophagaceae bacterium]